MTEFKPAVKEGYTFDGWYLDAEFKLPTASIDATQTGEVVLHAKFTLNPPVDPETGKNLELGKNLETRKILKKMRNRRIPEIPRHRRIMTRNSVKII